MKLTREEWYQEFAKPVLPTNLGIKNPYCQILTAEEVRRAFWCGHNINWVGYREGDKGCVFFTSNYHFCDKLGDKFVHVSGTTRNTAVPRPGCEDGHMNTLEKFKAVFHAEDIYIYSKEELVDFLDTIGMVEKD